MRNIPGKRLTILSDAEKVALYGLPDFDDFQRVEFFAMTDAERILALQRKGLEEQIYCLLQIGYFKAKQAFFQFSLEDAPTSDIAFLLQRYFPGKELAENAKPLSKRKYYAQLDDISDLFGYRLCSDADLPVLLEKAMLLARTDVTPSFLLAELMVFLVGQRIVQPGYTTLQELISNALTAERDRLEQLVEAALDDATRETLNQLLVRNDSFVRIGGAQARCQELSLPPNGLGTSKAPHAYTTVRYCQNLAAKLGDFATQHCLLRQLGQFLHH